MAVLSVLELAAVGSGRTPAEALAETTEVARAAERLGYRRIWVAEHHGMVQVASSAPAVLIAHLAAATSTIRVGAGGVMLPNHAPLVVAEQFGMLEALHPGRIDLGLGRAPGSDFATSRALRRTGTGERFPDDVVELFGYFEGRPDLVEATPARGYRPEIWILGSSLFGAEFAAAVGLPFSFAHHFMPDGTDAAVAAYRRSFRPGIIDRPRLSLGVVVVCAPTDEEARYLAGPAALGLLQRRTGVRSLVPSPEEAAAYPYTPAEREYVDAQLAHYAIGSPETVRRHLDALVERTGADELILLHRCHALADRLASLELVAAAYGLAPLAAG